MENQYSQNNNGGSNNNNFENRVSTAGITLFDQDNMMLRLSYLGDALSLSICQPVINDSGRKSYPETHRHPTLITGERACALYYDVIEKRILPAIEAGTDRKEGIFLNRSKTAILQIRVQNKEVYLILCTNINNERVAENSYVFHFQKTDIIEGYTPDGQMEEQNTVEGAFYLFCRWLKAGIDSITAAPGHSIRKSEQYSKNSIFNHLKAIAAKLGVTVETQNRWNGNRGNSGSYQNNNAAPVNNDFMQIPEGSAEELPFDSSPSAASIDDILS